MTLTHGHVGQGHVYMIVSCFMFLFVSFLLGWTTFTFSHLADAFIQSK